jgi:hypothetical protein
MLASAATGSLPSAQQSARVTLAAAGPAVCFHPEEERRAGDVGRLAEAPARKPAEPGRATGVA